MVRTKLAVALALIGAALSPIAHALGLGSIDVRSALNQPLDARVPLLPADAGEIESLSISLASAEAFHRAGIDRPFSLTRLKFKVMPGDEPYVHVYTEQPVKEPFLDFLLQADWDRGRLMREFTILLDPPIHSDTQVATPAAVLSTPERSSPEPDRPERSSSAPITDSAAAVAAAAAPATEIAALPDDEEAPAAEVSRYGPVVANDTLWKAATRLRPDSSISIHQTMVALLRANPDAFIDGDMNRLRRGAVLQVPDMATMAAIDASQAQSEVREHIERWRQARRETTAAPDRLEVLAPAGSGDSEAAGEDSSARPAPADRADVERLEQELKLQRESAVNLQAENEDLKEQVASLKRELAELERLIKLQVEQPVLPSADSNAGAQDATEPNEPAAAEPAQESAAEPAAATKPPPQPAPAVTTPNALGFLDDPRNQSLLAAVGLGLLALLLLAIRRRRKAAQDEASSEGLPLAETDPEPAAQGGNSAAEQADVNPLDDLPPDADALDEVNIYLAYGRHEQAREAVGRALRDAPDRIDLQLKQLEILAEIGDADAFAVAAGVLHGQVDESDQDWLRVAELGRELLPSHPLFDEAPEAMDSGLDDVTVDQIVGQEEGDQELDLDATLDFDSFAIDSVAEVAALDTAAEPDPLAQTAAPTADEFSLDFDLTDAEPATGSEPENTTAKTAASPQLAEPMTTADEGLDFELGDLSFDDTLEDSSTTAADNVVEFAQPPRADSDEADDLTDLDEAGVKLDLARAYLEMGDREGARSLLDEVLAEGSQQQRQEAENLLGQLA